jgi:hypothetical protein
MSYSPDTTNGVAEIEVDSTSPAQVTVTHRVKSAANNVVWKVFNATLNSADVCVANFKEAGVPVSPGMFTFLQNNCASVPAGSTRVISVHLGGTPGVVYTYDVTVGGSVAADPELEI